MSNGNFQGLRQVGEFSNFGRQRLIRSQKNPLDKCTIVSIFPKAIDEEKYTIEPGKFHIDAGTYDSPSILVVGSSSWWKEMGEEQPVLEIPNSSIQVAESVIKDWANGLLACNMGDRMPGLFYILGETNVLEIKMRYKDKLAEIKQKQDNWFAELVKIADSLWARSNGNPLVIWDEMRLGARELGLDNKPWLKDYTSVEMIKCIACGALKNPEFPVCPSCHAVDQTHPLAKDLKFA